MTTVYEYVPCAGSLRKHAYIMLGTLHKACLLCSGWATESAPTVCQGLCISPAYWMPGVPHTYGVLKILHKACLLSAESLHKAHLLCVRCGM